MGALALSETQFSSASSIFQLTHLICLDTDIIIFWIYSNTYLVVMILSVVVAVVINARGVLLARCQSCCLTQGLVGASDDNTLCCVSTYNI